MSVLVRIKQMVLTRRVVFTEKAKLEMKRDGLTIDMVYESIVNAPAIIKTIRSTNPVGNKREYLHIILSPTYAGIYIYSKGRIHLEQGVETLYILISAKRNLDALD